MFFKGLPLTIRLNYQTISFKNIITGGWALKFQANPNYFLGPTLMDRATELFARERLVESFYVNVDSSHVCS